MEIPVRAKPPTECWIEIFVPARESSGHRRSLSRLMSAVAIVGFASSTISDGCENSLLAAAITKQSGIG